MYKENDFIGKRALFSSFAVAVSSLALVSTSANATLLTYEGFNYGSVLSQDQSAVISPGGLGGGDSFGWAAPWSSSAGTNQFMVNTLSYANGGTLLTDGGALRVGVVHGTTAANTTAQLQRQLGSAGVTDTLGSIAAANGGTLWLSFLYQNQVNDPLDLATPGYASAYLAFMTGATIAGDGASSRNGTDFLGVGGGNTSTAGVPFGTTIGAIGANTGFVSIDANATNSWGPNSLATLFVLKLEVDNTIGNDTISLWNNPVIGLGEGGLGAPTVTYSTNLSSVNGFRFQAGNNNGTRTNTVMVVDEFRLGTTFNEVTPVVPEPAVAAILGVGLSGMFVMLRRKRS